MHPNRDKILIDIKRRLKEGKTQYEITEFIRSNYELPPSGQNIVWMIRECRSLLEREMDFNLRDIMIKNAACYEMIWKKNYSNPFSKKLENPEEDLEDQDARKTLFKISNHYMIAADALRRKEKMLGITHNRMDIQLKNEYYEQEEKNNYEKPSSFDPSKLSLQENLELLELLKKAKGEFQEQTTKITTTVTIAQDKKEDKLKYESVIDQFDIEDVEHEDVTKESGQLFVDKINRGIIQQESNNLEKQIKDKKAEERKRKVLENKKIILDKYRKSK
jgi:hypothetical protein